MAKAPSKNAVNKRVTSPKKSLGKPLSLDREKTAATRDVLDQMSETNKQQVCSV